MEAGGPKKIQNPSFGQHLNAECRCERLVGKVSGPTAGPGSQPGFLWLVRSRRGASETVSQGEMQVGHHPDSPHISGVLHHDNHPVITIRVSVSSGNLLLA